jgi:beta-glucosidase/6-phospho-beta-glucosidase/beta-galactosidase
VPATHATLEYPTVPRPGPVARVAIEPETFFWATGIEDTFITAPWPASGRTLDEYELTGHYDQWARDFELMAHLGVRTARYGIPWHRVQPEPDRWDWTWPDRTLNRLLELGINPIVDLVHYGLPGWMDGAFLNPEFPDRMAEYASRLAERFQGRIRWYTPLNEPRITGWYTGKLGWWPPYRRGWSGFVPVMVAIAKGIVKTSQALRELDPEMVLVHVDATDVYESPDPTLADEVTRRQEIGFLALDLAAGKVDEAHALRSWLRRNGASETDLDWFADRAILPDMIGLNMYPMFSRKRLVRSSHGLRSQMPYASGDLVERVAELYWERYGLPMMISETAARKHRRMEWLEGSLASVRRTRERGIPLVGYTWWPMFALVAWAYRQSNRPVRDYLEQMGLWDLEPGPGDALRRVPTPLVDAYRERVTGGCSAVGLLGNAATAPR